MDAEDGRLPENEIRSQYEIALRALGLYVVWCIALNYDDRKGYITWIEKNNFKNLFSENEIAFIYANPAPKQQIVNISWHCERLLILLWCLDLIDDLPAADTQCDTSVFLEFLPPLNGDYVVDFLSKVELRPADDLWILEEKTERQHWKARNTKIIDEGIDLSLIHI